MGKKTKLKIKLDKPYYVAGQVINGVIMIKNKKPIMLDKVYVKMKGVEKIKWEEHWQTHEHDEEGNVTATHNHQAEFDEKEVFFKNKVKITGKDAELAPGKWSFPFSIQLPLKGKKGNKLTGSFKLKEDNTWDWNGARGRVEDLKAKIEYSMKACVDLDWAKDLEKKEDIVIYEQLLSAIPMPHGKKEANVMVCFCCNKGACSVEATLSKNFYCSGEMGEAICTIDNQSTKEVQAAAELNRLLRLKADGHTIYDKDMMKLGRFDMVGPGEKKEIRMKFQIPKALPSTDGHYIDCAYVMDILAEVSMAPDIEVHFPVSIMVPPIEYQPDPEEDESTYVRQRPCVVEGMAAMPAGYAAPAEPVLQRDPDRQRAPNLRKSSTPPRKKSMGGGLPAGWSAKKDPSSGREYYINASSGETSWERPEGGPSLPAGWAARTDPKSGRSYYQNASTGETTWTLPGAQP